MQDLRQKEEAIEMVSAVAKEEWSKLTCDKIVYASNPKEMWDNFRMLTTYQEKSGGGGGGGGGVSSSHG